MPAQVGLEGGADGEAEGLARLAQHVVRVVTLYRLLVGVEAGSGIREEALELLRADRLHWRQILVETQWVVSIVEPEGRVNDAQVDLQLGAIGHTRHKIRTPKNRQQQRELHSLPALTGAVDQHRAA